MRARNPVFWPKMGIKNRGFRVLVVMTSCVCFGEPILPIFYRLQSQGDMQLKPPYNMRKTLEKCNNIGFEPKWMVTSHDLQRTRDYSNPGVKFASALPAIHAMFTCDRRSTRRMVCFRTFKTILCSPNEDLGSPNERLGTSFRSGFQMCIESM